MLVTAANILPKGLFIDEIIRVARSELAEECDYSLEAAHQINYRKLVAEDKVLQNHVKVPEIYEHLSTSKVLTSRFVPGIPIDKVQRLSQV
jgi:aarF domain-containing kinase